MFTSITLPKGNTESLAPGLSRKWIYDCNNTSQAVIFTLTDSSTETLEAWCDATKSVTSKWPDDRPFLVLHDCSRIPPIINPIVVDLVRQLFRVRAPMLGRLAVVVPNMAMVVLVQYLMRGRQLAPLQVKICFSRDEGLQWLLGLE